MTFALFSRYTRHLIGKARHVTAVDFMEKFVEKNRKDNSHLGNAEFIQADVTKLDFAKHRWEKTLYSHTYSPSIIIMPASILILFFSKHILPIPKHISLNNYY